MNGFRGETVSLFRPAFKNHAMTVLIDEKDPTSGPITQVGRNRYTFNGKDLREVLDTVNAFYLVKVLVPAYSDDDLRYPLEFADDTIA